MKIVTKFFLILLITFYFSATIKAEPIKIYYKEKLIETMTVEQFQALIKGAKNYSEEIKAEKNNRIKIFLKDDPWNLIKDKKYVTYAYIYWYNENQEVIKKLELQIILKTSQEIPDKTLIDKILEIYKPTAYYCFPLSIILNLILIGVLAL